jgi:ribosomal-protein-alanine N-acetyltransferase
MAMLAALHTACFDKGWNEQAVRELFAIFGTTAFIAPGNKGFGVLRQLGHEAEILTLAVSAPYRKQGMGKAIVTSMCAWAKGQGIKAIFLEVRQSNIAAQELYRQNGFNLLSQRKDYYRSADGVSEDAVVMKWP